ncbi:MAG: NAD(P)/FAD-dependent oxidoreductase [Caulobacteraceae bacterium]
MSQHDLIIIGGGIAGSALACVMAEAGKDVLVLEPQTAYVDRVRGEWIAPWGVAETQRVGLYDTLRAAGGHHLGRHITFDPSLGAQTVNSEALPLSFLPGVPGPLCIGHPHHCETLITEAARRGARVLRGAEVTTISPGAAPSVTYVEDGVETTAHARLIVGADGRLSKTREAAGIALHQDRPHHWFAGLLVDGTEAWPDDLQAIGTEGDFGFLVFPQGQGKARLYGGYPLDQKSRFVGEEGPRRFLDAFRTPHFTENNRIAAGAPAGPLFAYFNNDSWTDQPFAEGVVLVGDAAGWNDPIIGQGLSITYRDVRIVTELLKAGETDLRPYAEERAERMRRLRYAASMTSIIDMEFGPEADARRARHHASRATHPERHAYGFAVMAGPEMLPAEVFSDANREALRAS